MTTTPPACRISRLAGFALITPKADALAAFYEQAFGARRLATDRVSDPCRASVSNAEADAARITLCLGTVTIELLEFAQPGALYPPNMSSSDLIFQHFAIVVSDMGRAYGRLSQIAGWTPISSHGPVLLPASSGGVTAFKFRDPDGHPLELLSFPNGREPERWRVASSPELCLGIDHSAISVSDSARSISFYESFGLRLIARTLNHGVEQDSLDGLCAAKVDVIALAAENDTPHLELLCYEYGAPRSPRILQSNDVAATRLLFAAPRQLPELHKHNAVERMCLRDPDGHHLMIMSE